MSVSYREPTPRAPLPVLICLIALTIGQAALTVGQGSQGSVNQELKKRLDHLETVAGVRS